MAGLLIVVLFYRRRRIGIFENCLLLDRVILADFLLFKDGVEFQEAANKNFRKVLVDGVSVLGWARPGD